MSDLGPIRMTVEPFPIKGVKENHVVGVFGNLTDVIEARIRVLEKNMGKRKAEIVKFWRFALRNLVPEIHANIQRKYLVRGGKVRLSGLDDSPEGGLYQGMARYQDMAKYIDPIEWLESKLRLCKEIDLHLSAPLSILDVGTGPGHFPFAARFFGHDVVGLDLPEEVHEEGQTFLYDDLCKFYGVRRIPFTITAECDLPDTGKRYDLVTAFLTAFNTLPKSQSASGATEHWGPSDWDRFLEACFRVWLKRDGRLILSLTHGKLREDSWSFLSSRANKVEPKKLRLEISRASAMIG